MNRLGQFNGAFYALQVWGLYLEGLIHGGACFRNFTVDVGYKRGTVLQ